MSHRTRFQRQIAVVAAFCAIAACGLAIVVRSTIAPPSPVFQVVPVDALRVPPSDDAFNPPIPSAAIALDGQRIQINGFMQPTLTWSGFDQYLISPETKHRPVMTHVKPLPLHGLIPVIPAIGHTEFYTDRPITVEGVLRIHVQSDCDGVFSVYQIEDARIIQTNVRGLHPPAVSWFGC